LRSVAPFIERWVIFSIDCATLPIGHVALAIGLVERFKSSFQISKSNWVFEKDVASKYSLRLPQLEYTRFPRAANEPPCPGEGYADVARKGRF